MKLSYPRQGWAEVRWEPNEDVPAEVADAVADLSYLPGVRHHAGPDWTQLDVPRNAWTTEAWRIIADWEPAPLDVLRIGRIALAQTHEELDAVASHLWAPKQPLYGHQVEAARFLVENQGGLCADQMGLGKTRVAIVAAQTLAALNDSTRPRVIVAPGYTRDVWRRELLAVGAIKDESEMAAAFTRVPSNFDWDAPWWFIHYDIAHWWQGHMAVRRPVVAILDEIHWAKNGRAKRSKAAGAIAGTASARIALTGTPLSNRPSELWWPLTIIDGPGSWGSPKDFRIRYCGAEHDGYGLQDTRPTHVAELRTRLERRYIRRTIESAGVELPPLTRRPLRVPLDAKSLAEHEEVVSHLGYEKLLDALLRGTGGQDTLAQITKLRKLVSKCKLDATVQLAADMLEQGESVVVFTWQKKTADKLCNKIAQQAAPLLSAFVVHGEHAQVTRDLSVKHFQERGGLLVATLGALREGVTLTAARHLILHDLDWVPANVLQAEARVYRIGQTRPTQVTWMLAENSIDEMLAAVLVEKGKVMRQTLGIDAADEAFHELALEGFIGEASVEAEVSRLLATWGAT